MKNTKWKTRRKQAKEVLQAALLTPMYITAWIICILVVVLMDLAWRIERRIKS